MERKWTDSQKKSIDVRGKNVLVSAAAGSGKTAVLVERIISMITDADNPVDIDRLVVVTFTKAAAAQMKDKIRDALDERLDDNPHDNNLLRQITLLNNALITTIDSFCLWIVRNYFPEIELDPSFRVMDEGERKLLEKDVLNDVLEEYYSRNDEEFFRVVDAYGIGRDDSKLEDIIGKIYAYARSNPYVDDWYDECIGIYDDDTCSNPAAVEVYESIVNSLSDYKEKYESMLEVCNSPGGPYPYCDAIQSDYAGITNFLGAPDLGELVRRIMLFKFEKFARITKSSDFDETKQEYVKAQRDIYKKFFKKISENLSAFEPEIMSENMRGAGIAVRTLIDVVRTYADRLAAVKKEKGIIDFNDMEHYALDILVKREDGKLVYTETADRLADRFAEILIDEYQDSNRLQEAIITAVSKSRRDGMRNNVYMVGDVKQSIYRFRLACPELFIEKYNSYSEDSEECIKIDLQHNFRSRSNILECTNDVFSRVMNSSFSSIAYSDAVRLNAGLEYPKCYASSFADSDRLATDVVIMSSDEDDEFTAREIEVAKVADIVENLIADKTNVYDADSGEYRPIEYRDIVILTRSLRGWSDVFAEALMDRGIPAYTDTAEGYFSVREIQVIMSMLTIVDNPVQEISLAAGMMSYFGGFTSGEIGIVRQLGREYIKEHDKARHNNLYEQLKVVADMNNEVSGKCALFLAKLNEYRDKSSVMSVYDLCWEMIFDSGYYDYVGTMPAGSRRQANLNILLERADGYGTTGYSGLFNFLRYIERLKKFDEDFDIGAASSENENLVRIMSIHKSKGLEFPVVILVGAHKKFNHGDENGSVVIDQQFGVAIDYIDTEKRTKNPTIIKFAAARNVGREAIAEEERLLYVAMTRAREKLIVTGVVKDAYDMVTKYKNKIPDLRFKGVFSYADSEAINCYLDMIMPVCILPEEDLGGKFRLIIAGSPADIYVGGNIPSDAADEKEQEDGRTSDANVPPLDDLPEYKPAEGSTGKIKVTVSELKAMRYEADTDEYAYIHESLVTEEKLENPIIPRFVSGEEKKLAANERGIAYHRVMECLNYSKITDSDSVAESIEGMKASGKITQMQADSVRASDIYAFVSSKVGARTVKAEHDGKLRREQPFVFETDGQLVQGVIDMYFEEDGELVIVDYKTDRVKRGKAGEEELIKRYGVQLDYYAKALEQITGKRVKEKIIYSFTLGIEVY